MRQEKKERTISALCAPVLLLILAAGILTVLLGSAGIYQRLNSRESGDRRTAALYLTNKVRQAPGAVSVEPFGEGQALVIREQVEGTVYMTRIYCLDGWLRELFTPASGKFAPGDGEKVLPMAGLELTMEAGLLELVLTDAQGNRDVLRLLPTVGEEALP